MPSSSLASNRHRDSPASSISFQYRRPTSKRPLTFLAPPKIDREREDARHEICDETVRIDEFARQVRRDRRHLQRQASPPVRSVGCVWTSGAMATVAMLRGAARSAGERALQRSNASRPKRHTRSLDAPRRGTDASGETRARTTRARRATRADAKEGRARARGDGVEWLDRRIGSARRVGTRSTRRHPIDRGRDRRDAEDEARCIGGGARARGGAGGPRADDVATDRHQGDGASRRGQGGAATRTRCRSEGRRRAERVRMEKRNLVNRTRRLGRVCRGRRRNIRDFCERWSCIAATGNESRNTSDQRTLCRSDHTRKNTS